MWGSNPYLLRGSSGFWGRSQLCVVVSVVGFVVKLCRPLLPTWICFFFLIYPVCKSHSANFGVTFSKYCCTCSYKVCVSVGGGEFKILLCYHLEPEHYFFSLSSYHSQIHSILFLLPLSPLKVHGSRFWSVLLPLLSLAHTLVFEVKYVFN